MMEEEFVPEHVINAIEPELKAEFGDKASISRDHINRFFVRTKEGFFKIIPFLDSNSITVTYRAHNSSATFTLLEINWKTLKITFWDGILHIGTGPLFLIKNAILRASRPCSANFILELENVERRSL